MDKEISLASRNLFLIASDENLKNERYMHGLARMMRRGKIYRARLETGEWLFVAEEAAYADMDGNILPGLKEWTD